MLALVRLRAPLRGIAAGGQQVFGAPGDAVQRAAIQAAGYLSIGALGLGVGQRLGEGDDALQGRVVAFEPGEVHLGQLARGDLACADELGQLGEGEEGGVLQIGRAGNGRGGADGVAAGDGGGRGVGGVDVELERHRHAVIEIGSADADVLLAAAADDFEHLLALGGGEVEAEQGCGGGDLVGGDGGDALGHGGILGALRAGDKILTTERTEGTEVILPVAGNCARNGRQLSTKMFFRQGGNLAAAGYAVGKRRVERRVARVGRGVATKCSRFWGIGRGGCSFTTECTEGGEGGSQRREGTKVTKGLPAIAVAGNVISAIWQSGGLWGC